MDYARIYNLLERINSVFEIYVRTLDVPWFKFIEINLADDIQINPLTGDLLPQVVYCNSSSSVG